MATKARSKAAGGLRGLRSSASTTNSKKSSVPTVKGPDELQDAIARWKEGKSMEKEGKSKREIAEGELLGPAAELRLAQCQADKKLHAAIKMVCGTESLKATQAARWLKMVADESEDRLRANFGDEFDKLFTVTEGISISDEIDPRLEAKLSDVLSKNFSEDELGQMLKFDPQIKPTEQFAQKSVFDGKVRKLAESAQEDGLCQPIKISFRM